VKSHLTKNFVKLYGALPEKVKIIARKNYKIWKKNPSHPSINFKEIKEQAGVYSIRIGLGWRALGVIQNDSIIWFWIGSHSDYNKMISK
jgi:hypothetical protein